MVLIALYRAKPGMGDHVAQHLQALAAAVRANEPGCLSFTPVRANDDPDSFAIYEVYTDAAALAAHRETEHFQRLVLQTIVPLLIERNVRQYHTL